jgi:hypothetical protein
MIDFAINLEILYITLLHSLVWISNYIFFIYKLTLLGSTKCMVCSECCCYKRLRFSKVYWDIEFSGERERLHERDIPTFTLKCE